MTTASKVTKATQEWKDVPNYCHLVNIIAVLIDSAYKRGQDDTIALINKQPPVITTVPEKEHSEKLLNELCETLCYEENDHDSFQRGFWASINVLNLKIKHDEIKPNL